MLWKKVGGANKGTPSKLRLSKNKRVTVAPLSPTINQNESDTDDGQTTGVRGKRGEETKETRAEEVFRCRLVLAFSARAGACPRDRQEHTRRLAAKQGRMTT